MDEQIAKLAERFKPLGCSDPEGWARSEEDGEITQLARFVFLQELWKLVIAKTDYRALNRYTGPNDDGRGGALRRIKEAGVKLDDLLTIVRAAQTEVVRDVTGLIDNLGDLGPDLRDIRWGLYLLDAEYRPTKPLDSLHESVDDESFEAPSKNA